MNIADMLNPTDIMSPPLSPKSAYSSNELDHHHHNTVHGKPRSRFSELEDTIICEGVAKGLTWGQISSQLPHRKRATCFNRYRTLQGIRKSRKKSTSSIMDHPSHPLQNNNNHNNNKYLPTSPTSSPPSINTTPAMSPCSTSWTPTTPPSELYLSSYPLYPMDDPLIRKLSISKDRILPPIYTRSNSTSSSSSSLFDRCI
ncbi:unnamed protein product [Cunninghamella echinulata]